MASANVVVIKYSHSPVAEDSHTGTSKWSAETFRIYWICEKEVWSMNHTYKRHTSLFSMRLGCVGWIAPFTIPFFQQIPAVSGHSFFLWLRSALNLFYTCIATSDRIGMRSTYSIQSAKAALDFRIHFVPCFNGEIFKIRMMELLFNLLFFCRTFLCAREDMALCVFYEPRYDHLIYILGTSLRVTGKVDSLALLGPALLHNKRRVNCTSNLIGHPAVPLSQSYVFSSFFTVRL